MIKGGEIVIEEGDIRETPDGREYLVKPSYDPDTEEFLRPLFEDRYCMSFENYPVEMERIERPHRFKIAPSRASPHMSQITLTAETRTDRDPRGRGRSRPIAMMGMSHRGDLRQRRLSRQAPATTG